MWEKPTDNSDKTTTWRFQWNSNRQSPVLIIKYQNKKAKHWQTNQQAPQTSTMHNDARDWLCEGEHDQHMHRREASLQHTKKHTDASSKKQYSFVWAGLRHKKRTDALLKKWYSFSWDSLHHKKAHWLFIKGTVFTQLGQSQSSLLQKNFPSTSLSNRWPLLCSLRADPVWMLMNTPIKNKWCWLPVVRTKGAKNRPGTLQELTSPISSIVTDGLSMTDGPKTTPNPNLLGRTSLLMRAELNVLLNEKGGGGREKKKLSFLIRFQILNDKALCTA